MWAMQIHGAQEERYLTSVYFDLFLPLDESHPFVLKCARRSNATITNQGE